MGSKLYMYVFVMLQRFVSFFTAHNHILEIRLWDNYSTNNNNKNDSACVLCVSPISTSISERKDKANQQWQQRLVCFARYAFLSDYHTITKTRLYNSDPFKPHFYVVKLGFTGVYIIFLISAQKHRLWVLVRTASSRWF